MKTITQPLNVQTASKRLYRFLHSREIAFKAVNKKIKRSSEKDSRIQTIYFLKRCLQHVMKWNSFAWVGVFHVARSRPLLLFLAKKKDGQVIESHQTLIDECIATLQDWKKSTKAF